MHALADATAYVPTAHDVVVTDPTTQYEPAGHATHTVESVAGWYWPEAQLEQLVDPVLAW